MNQIPTFTGKGKSKKTKIYKLLLEFGNLNTQQIRTLINNNSKYGMTTHEVTSTLVGMKKHIEEVGFCQYAETNIQSRVRCIIWGLKK